MSLYRCVLLNARGGLRTGEMIDSASVQGAVMQGRRIIAHRPHYDAFEIWEETRLLHAEDSERSRRLQLIVGGAPPIAVRPMVSVVATSATRGG